MCGLKHMRKPPHAGLRNGGGTHGCGGDVEEVQVDGPEVCLCLGVHCSHHLQLWFEIQPLSLCMSPCLVMAMARERGLANCSTCLLAMFTPSLQQK